MAVNLIYQHGSDQVADNATITVQTGTVDPEYPASNLVDSNPAKPAKILETSGAWKFAFAGAQRVDFLAIPHHNLTAGLQVRIQGNATDAWGAPTFNALITIPTWRDDGWPVGPWLDLTAQAGYSAGGFQYWRLTVVGANAAPVALGEVWLGSAIRTLSPNISWGAREGEQHKITEQETDFGVTLSYDFGLLRRTLVGEVDATDAAKDAVRAWWRSTNGRARPTIIVPEGTVNEALMVRWAEPKIEVTREVLNRNTIPLAFQEVSRGLPF
jgi:hypothetical protein